jgi:hypothetical protein
MRALTRRRTSSWAGLYELEQALDHHRLGDRLAPARRGFQIGQGRVFLLLPAHFRGEALGQPLSHLLRGVLGEGVELGRGRGTRHGVQFLQCGHRRRGEEAGVRQQNGAVGVRQVVGEVGATGRKFGQHAVFQDAGEVLAHALLSLDARGEFGVECPERLLRGSRPTPASRRRRPAAHRDRPACGSAAIGAGGRSGSACNRSPLARVPPAGRSCGSAGPPSTSFRRVPPSSRNMRPRPRNPLCARKRLRQMPTTPGWPSPNAAAARDPRQSPRPAPGGHGAGLAR